MKRRRRSRRRRSGTRRNRRRKRRMRGMRRSLRVEVMNDYGILATEQLWHIFSL
jgi:hypothetical protein